MTYNVSGGSAKCSVPPRTKFFFGGGGHGPRAPAAALPCGGTLNLIQIRHICSPDKFVHFVEILT